MSSVQDVARTMVGVWRPHTRLSETEGDSSPEAPERSRKLRSSTSMNSPRMSLQKCLPLKPKGRGQNSPDKRLCPDTVTPKRRTQRTRKSAGKRTPRVARTSKQQNGVSKRSQLVRVEALTRFAPLEPQRQRRCFEEDMDSLSSDFRNLEGLSPAITGTDEPDDEYGRRSFR